MNLITLRKLLYAGLNVAFIIATMFFIFSQGQTFAEISDGANGGNDHFYFLPPLVSNPSPTGSFSDTLSPVVQICEWTGTECVTPPVAEFTTTSELAAERVRAIPEDEHYIVNFLPLKYNIDRKKTYRIRVLLRLNDGIQIEQELGHIDVTRLIPPIQFRIEEGVFPIAELTPLDRGKISPVLLEQFISQEVVEPIEALVNLFDDQISLSELDGIELIHKYNHFDSAFVRISNLTSLAYLASQNSIQHVYENEIFKIFSPPSDSLLVKLGQNKAERSGYIGTGTAVAILDDGGGHGAGLPFTDEDWLVDLENPIFGGCTDVGIPESCRVVAMVDLYPNDTVHQSHMGMVTEYVAAIAPGTKLILIDTCFGNDCDSNSRNLGLDWVLDHREEFNIVAVNISQGRENHWYSTDDCEPDYDKAKYKKCRDAEIMLIAGSGNWGSMQIGENDFSGVSYPACSSEIVSVASECLDGFYDRTIRGPNLDLLAPGCQDTSFSAPQGSGAWAVLRAALPDVSLDDTLELLKKNGDPIYDIYSGLTKPMIRIDAALRDAGLPVLVYDNGSSTHSGGSAVGHMIAADDFILDADTNISRISVDVSDGPADQNRRWDETVEWWLFGPGGLQGPMPGQLIASGTGINIKTKNMDVHYLGDRSFTVDFDLDQEVWLPAGQRFWLALHMQADYSRVSVTWDFQGSTIYYPSRTGGELIEGVPNFVDGPNAGPSEFDKAFRLW